MFNLTDKQTTVFNIVAEQIRRPNAPFIPRWVFPGDTREDSTRRLMLNGLAAHKVLTIEGAVKGATVYTITPAALAAWKQRKALEAEAQAADALWSALTEGGLYVPTYLRSCRGKFSGQHAGVRPVNRKAGICLFSVFAYRDHVAIETFATEGRDATLKAMQHFMPLIHWQINPTLD